MNCEMNMKQTLTRAFAYFTVVAFGLASTPQLAQAGMIGTGTVVDTAVAAAQRADNLARAQSLLARADVQQQLQKLGVNAADAAQRVASLSDAELQLLAKQADSLPAGGDSALAVIGIVFIVLLILDYTGTIHIFRR